MSGNRIVATKEDLAVACGAADIYVGDRPKEEIEDLRYYFKEEKRDLDYNVFCSVDTYYHPTRDLEMYRLIHDYFVESKERYAKRNYDGTEGAVQFFTTLEATQPYNSALALGIYYLKETLNPQPQVATEYFEKACLIDPDNIIAHQYLAGIYSDAKQDDLAQYHYERMLENIQGSMSAEDIRKSNLKYSPIQDAGHFFFRQKNFDRSAEIYKFYFDSTQSFLSNSSYFAARYYLVACLRTGNTADLFTKVQSIYREDELLSILIRAAYYASEMKPEAALSDLQDAVKLVESDSSKWKTVPRLMFDVNFLQDSLFESLQGSPQFESLQARLGLVPNQK